MGVYIGIDREEKDKNVFILAEMPQEAISPCLLSEPQGKECQGRSKDRRVSP